MGSLPGSATLSSVLVSGATRLESCASAVSSSVGSVKVSCDHGTLSADVAGCQAVCKASATASTILFGSQVTGSPGQDLSDGDNWVTQCSKLLAGTEGNALLKCKGGVLDLMVSQCVQAPCRQTSSVRFTLGFKTGPLSPVQEISSGDSGDWSCSSFNPDYVGQGSLACSFGQLSVDASNCTCIPENPMICKAPCLNTTSLAVQIGSSVVNASAGSQIKSGTFIDRNCSVVAGYVGTFKLNCEAGTLSADTAGCSGTPCGPSTPAAKFEIGGKPGVIGTKHALRSATSFETSCSSLNAAYEGMTKVTCSFGTLAADTKGCGPRSCTVGMRNLVVGGYSLSLKVPGPAFGANYTNFTRPVTSGWQGRMDCGTLHKGLTGNISATCSYGNVSFATTDCYKSCLAPADFSATYNRQTTTLKLTQSMLGNGQSATRDCQPVFAGLKGTMKVQCNRGTMVSDMSTCSQVSCSKGGIVTVALGSVSRTVSAPAELLGGKNFTQACSIIDAAYTGNFVVTCVAGTLSASTDGCATKPGVETKTVTKVKSAMTMQLPQVSGATHEDLHKAMQAPSVKKAVGASIAEALNVSSDRVLVTGISVLQGRRLERAPGNLRQLSGSAQMKVDYEVVVPVQKSGAGGGNTTLSAASLQAKMSNIGKSASAESTKFAASLGKNLVKAAKEDTSGSSGSSVLSSMSQAVQTKGVAVLHVAEPQVVQRQVAAAPSSPSGGTGSEESKTGTHVAIGIAAAVIVIAFAVFAFFIYTRECKRTQDKVPLSSNEDLSLEEVSNHDQANAPASDVRDAPLAPSSSGGGLQPRAGDEEFAGVDMGLLASCINTTVQGYSDNSKKGATSARSGASRREPVEAQSAELDDRKEVQSAIDEVRRKVLAQEARRPVGQGPSSSDSEEVQRAIAEARSKQAKQPLAHEAFDPQGEPEFMEA